MEPSEQERKTIIDRLIQLAERCLADNVTERYQQAAECYGLIKALIKQWPKTEDNKAVRKEYKSQVQELTLKTLQHFITYSLRLAPNMQSDYLSQRLKGYSTALWALHQSPKESNDSAQAWVTEKTRELTQLFHDIVTFCLDMLRIPYLEQQTDLAVICLGSLATAMATGYSDIEYLILLSPERAQANRAKLAGLSDLVELLVTSLGETPIYAARAMIQSEFQSKVSEREWLLKKVIHKGVRIDTAKRPQARNYVIELTGSVESFLSQEAQWLFQPGNHIASSLLCPSFVLGNKNLLESLQEGIENRLRQGHYQDFLYRLWNHDDQAFRFNVIIPLEKQRTKKQLSKSWSPKFFLLYPLCILRDTYWSLMHSAKLNLPFTTNTWTMLEKLTSTLTQIPDLAEQANDLLGSWKRLLDMGLLLRLNAEIVDKTSGVTVTMGVLEEKHIEFIEELFRFAQLVPPLKRSCEKILWSSKTLLPEQLVELPTESMALETLSTAPQNTHQPATSEVERVVSCPKPISYFQSRTAILARIREYFQSSAGENQTAYVSLTGIAGSGKTELAIQYAQQSSARLIWWFDPQDTVDVTQRYLASYQSLLEALHIPWMPLGNEDRHITEQRCRELLAQKLRTEFAGQWLWVIDNVQTKEELRSLISPLEACNGQVLITTQQSHLWPDDLHNIKDVDIDGLSQEEAKDLLLTLSELTDEAGVNELAEHCEYLPLALSTSGLEIKAINHHLIRYRQPPITFRKYEESLVQSQRQRNEEHYHTRRGQRYQERQADVLTQAIKRTPSMLRKILSYCAFVHPVGIPFDLIEALVRGELVQQSYDSTVPEDKVYQAMYDLECGENNGSLLQYEPSSRTFRLHRSTQAQTEALISPADLDSIIRKLYEHLEQCITDEVYNEYDYDQKVHYLSHLLAIHRYLPRSLKARAEYFLGVLFKAQGNAAQSHTHYEQAIEMTENLLWKARIYNGLGRSYQAMANWIKTQENYQRASEVLDAVVRGMSVDDVSLGEVMALQALVLQNQGMWYQDIARAISRRKLTPEAVNVVSQQAAIDKAIQLIKKAIQILEANRALLNPDVYACSHIQYQFNLSECYRLAGDLNQARQLLKQAKSEAKVCFRDAPHRLRTLLYYNQGRYWESHRDFSKATNSYKKAVKMGLTLYKKPHPLVARHQHALAKALIVTDSSDGEISEEAKKNLHSAGINIRATRPEGHPLREMIESDMSLYHL